MTREQIESFLTPVVLPQSINISFKTRNSIRGIFLTTGDFEDLKSKNMWRVIAESKWEEWQETKNVGLAKIYVGTDFTKLKV